ncbi:hypothetical protein F383_28299 [Gossypium arboreum]|uniref:Disease resistance protein At4g27190-like leucine-rich repeats domain-containing protein n=1 Tax=Gossypium arboreum TaxID=29729 RepID=A0A0B0P7K7_GOSAR|nr:hypothetical protein F383_28299 [Gossypium arboreum]
MQGGDIISSLLNACLLERDGEDCVKMHDVIRDMALWITRKFEATENKFFVKAGAQLFEEPDVKAWKRVKRMSVMKNEIQLLKETPKCPNLRTLFLSNNNLKVISDDYPNEDNVLNEGHEKLIEELKENLEHLEALQFLDCGIMEIKMEKLSTWVSSSNCTSCFHALSTVQIFHCKKLRDMTWLILAPNLRNLDITGCYEMEEILSEEKLGEVAGVIGVSYPKSFLKLETLDLRHLPKLKSIYWDALPFPCLKHILIKYCKELKKLPLNLDSAKGNLLSIKGSKDWWARVEWENEVTRDAFLPSFKLLY